jgi:phosphoglycolate phosphatase
MIKNIIFDWSGTLSDDMASCYTATMGVLRKLGLKTMTFEEYQKEATLPYMNFYHKFKEDVDKEEVDRLFYSEINSANKPNPFPKIKELLEFLEKENIRIALLSAHPQRKLAKEIRDYGFQKFFVDVNGSVHDKVEAIMGIMKKNGFRPVETAFVGDMTHDIEAGREAKVTTIAVSWGYHPSEKLLKERPDFLIERPTDLKRLILSLNG